jgi:hypothetical protein
VEYILDGRKFSFSYSELRDMYRTYIEMTDEEFLSDIPAALHFATFVCFVKEIPGYVCLADTGIIHELVHVLQFGVEGSTTGNIEEIRLQFKEQLKLA